jgi:hypothetical protein
VRAPAKRLPWVTGVEGSNPSPSARKIRMKSDIDIYIDKQKLPHKEICLRLRKLILEIFPGIDEEMKWGVPAFAGGRFYIVALKNHINLGFASEGLTKDELKLFDGGGKTTRHLRIDSPDVHEERIVGLLKLVYGKNPGD